MNRTTRMLFAPILVGALAACAPAGDEGGATPEPMASMGATASADASAEPTPTASEDAMASHDMGGMGDGDAVTVDISNFAFVQDEVEVSVGDTVTWVNGDATRHTITSGSDDTADDAFDSGDVAAGDTFSFTFAEAGEVAYFCDIHPTMTGLVVVTP